MKRIEKRTQKHVPEIHLEFFFWGGYFVQTMKRFFLGCLCIIVSVSAALSANGNPAAVKYKLSNSAFSLIATINGSEVHVILEERHISMRLSEGNYIGFAEKVSKPFYYISIYLSYLSR